MKIEIIKGELRNEYEGDLYLSIDGEVDKQSIVYNEDGSGGISVNNEKTLKKLFKLSITELRAYFPAIYFKHSQKITEWDISFHLAFRHNVPNEETNETNELFRIEEISPSTINLFIMANARKWNNEYSIEDVVQLYTQVASKYNDIKYIPEESGFMEEGTIGEMRIEIIDEKKSLEDIFNYIFTYYEKISLEVLSLLPNNRMPDLLTTIFQFPDELKIACKQYLVYFAQFLADIGINADTSIKDDANNVLFTIIPENGSDALDKIKEALEIYMSAPANPEMEVILENGKNDISILQWQANVHHLKGQIALSQALIQTKDATIEALQLSNYRLKEDIVSLKQLEEGAANLKEEKFVKGTIAIKKYEGKGFSIDLPALIRLLRRKK